VEPYRFDSLLPAVLDAHSSFQLTMRYFPGAEPDFTPSRGVVWLFISSEGQPPESLLLPLFAESVDPVATLAVFDGTAPLVPGATISFGGSTAAFPATRTFTLKNTGNIHLQVQGVSLGDAGNPGDFTAGPPATELLPPGGSTTLPVIFAASGPGVRTATLRIASTDTFNLPFVMQLRGTLPQGPDAWRLTHFGTLLNEGPAADLSDPDGDGRPNLLEYAFLTNPRSPAETSSQLVKDGDYLRYTFSRPSDATAFVRYSLEWSDSPAGGWNSAGEVQEIIHSDDGTRQELTQTIATGSLPRQFVRVRVTRR
jgi:hypothetical protein